MLLITPAEVIRHAFSPRERISASSIRPLKIDIAQEHFIRPRLGDELFEKLVDGHYTDFTERYINPALAHFVRYGILAELCVEVGDRGALVYSSSSDQTQTARNQESADSQTKEHTDSSVVATTANNLTTLHDTTNTTKEFAGQTTTHGMSGGSLVDRVERYDDYTGRISNGTQNEQVDQQRTATDTAKTLVSGTVEIATDENRSASGERYRPATGAEVRALSVRTLSDAQILLAKAVRHLERRKADFVEYAPRGYANNIFF